MTGMSVPEVTSKNSRTPSLGVWRNPPGSHRDPALAHRIIGDDGVCAVSALQSKPCSCRRPPLPSM